MKEVGKTKMQVLYEALSQASFGLKDAIVDCHNVIYNLSEEEINDCKDDVYSLSDLLAFASDIAYEYEVTSKNGNKES